MAKSRGKMIRDRREKVVDVKPSKTERDVLKEKLDAEGIEYKGNAPTAKLKELAGE